MPSARLVVAAAAAAVALSLCPPAQAAGGPGSSMRGHRHQEHHHRHDARKPQQQQKRGSDGGVPACGTDPDQRQDCGHVGTNQQQCEAEGCCWGPLNPNPGNKPWCFKKTDAPAPAPAPAAPAPAPAPAAPAPKSPAPKAPAPTHHPAPAPGPVGPYDTVGKTFVHLFEWKWADVAQECEDFLGPHGYNGVQISPPSEHISGDAWWTRYQTVSYDLVSRSGSEAEFKDMVSRCSKVGVKIIADSVFNQMAGGSGTGINGHSFGGRAFPGLYGQDDFHHNDNDPTTNCVISNYDDQHEVQTCDLDGLPDLCTGCDHVQNTVGAYLKKMADAGVAGFRVDAAKHQEAGELGDVLAASGLQQSHFFFHEVIFGSGQPVTPSMYFGLGQVTEFNFAAAVGNAFKDGDLSGLAHFTDQLFESDKAVVFIDNHDTQRGDAALTYKNGQRYMLATAFMLAHPFGHPKVMSSYAFTSHDQGPPGNPVHSGGSGVNCGQGEWVCEHRDPTVAALVQFRRRCGAAPVGNFVTSQGGGWGAAFSRGSAGFVAFNLNGNAWTETFQSGLPAGTYTDVVSGSTKVTVGADGSLTATVPPNSVLALHV